MKRTVGLVSLWLTLALTPLPNASAKDSKRADLDRAPGAFAMMSLQQLGRLNHASRVQYLQLLRETLIEYEKLQNIFHVEMAANPFADKPELYALIVGDSANAADKFYRNLNKTVTDEGCIYGGHYQHYMTGQGAYGCIRPKCTKKIQSEWKSTYSKGKQFGDSYVQCSFTTFGIEWCVTPGINSTEACEKKSREMEAQREAEVTKWLAENVTDKWKALDAKERIKLVGELKERSFDPRIMSHLVKLAADYQKTHKNFDAVPELADFEGFDVNSQGMNALFRSFKEHCTKEMDADTAVKSVEEEKGPLAKRRQAYLKEVRAKGHPVRVGNVLQRKECEILIGKYNMDDDTFSGGRYKKLMDSYETISRQGYPDGLPERPATVVTEDDARQKLQPAEEVAVVEDVKVDPNQVVKSVATGCKPTHRLLIDRGMQCAKCVAEKSITEGEPGSYIKGPGVSEKWLALLTTMMHYCKREWSGSTIDPRDLTQMALEYSQTFGHCSEGEYKWESMSWEQQRLVQSWQLGREFDKTDSPVFLTPLRVKKTSSRMSMGSA